MSRTALVLGAGLGGLVAAEILRNPLPEFDRVIAMDRAAAADSPRTMPRMAISTGGMS